MSVPPPDLQPGEAESFGTMAAKCRRLADAIGDGPTRESLLKLAEDYELRSGQAPLARQSGVSPATH